MAASLDNEPQSKSNEPVITPQLPPSFALGAKHVAATTLFVVIFLFFSYLPLRATDLWGHTLWGRWILEQRTLPTEDPYFKLAAGMPVVDSAWLSQVIFAAVEQAVGAEGLSALFTLTVVAALLLFARSFFLISQRLTPTLLGVILVIVVGWSRATTLRPENFGVLCLAAVLWLVTRDQFAAQPPKKLTWLSWVAIAVVFCAWANLHGSYLVGLIVLGCIAVGQWIDVLRRERSLVASLRDANVQRSFFLSELALVATFVNPYGFELLIYNLTFAQNPNLTSILEWQPLVILGIGGRAFALSVVLLLVLWRISRAPVTATQVLLLAIFGYLSVKSVRMLGWYAPLYVWTTMPHLADLWSRLRPLPEVPPEPIAIDGTDYKLPPGRSFMYTLLCGLMIWLGIAFAPVGSVLLGGKMRAEERLYDKITSPLPLTAYLAKHPPQGPVFAPQHWGDWLIVRVPEIQPMVTSNIHLTPRQVWVDYERIAFAQPGWQRVLDRYRLQTLILDKQSQPILAQAMRQATDWAKAYEDDQAIVYLHRKVSGAPAAEAKPAADEVPGGESPDASSEMP